MKISAAILTGGKNSRLNGFPKYTLKINGISILEIQCQILQNIFDEIILCGEEINNPLNVKAIPDYYKNIGPISGIFSAIKNNKNSDAIFIFSADMPFLNKDLIYKMITDFEKEKDLYALVPQHSKNMIEPLHSIYSSKLLNKLETQINNKNYSIRNIFINENVKYFYVNLDLEPEKTFFNINTFEDYNKAKEYARQIQIRKD